MFGQRKLQILNQISMPSSKAQNIDLSRVICCLSCFTNDLCAFSFKQPSNENSVSPANGNPLLFLEKMAETFVIKIDTIIDPRSKHTADCVSFKSEQS